MHRPDRAGFTLVELLVALLVGGIVVAGARSMAEQLGASAMRTASAAARADRDANAAALLRALTLRLEVGTEEAQAFGGAPDITRFSSWCDVPGGWQERCQVTLTVVHGAEEDALRLDTSAGDSALLVRATRVELRYLENPAAGGAWFGSWGTGITAPFALGVVAGTETTLVRIGSRG